jgi:hypothetical protein
MNQISEIVYELNYNIDSKPYEAYSRIDGENDLWNDLWTNVQVYDKEFEPTQGEYYLSGITNYTDPMAILPQKIVMFGWFDLLPLTEMPSDSFGWTIISKKILEVVKNLCFTDYRLIHLRVVDRAQFDNVYSENPRKYEDDNAVKDLIYDDDMFYGFQVLPRVRLLTEDSDPDIKKIIWREDITDIPFFFRGERFASGLMVNQEARDALEKAGIQGIEFKPPFSL